MVTAPIMRTSCTVPGGIHMPRCGGITQVPWGVASTTTPETPEINCPRRCRWGGMAWPSG